MNKEIFIKILNDIKEQFDYDAKSHKAFSTILKNDYVSNYDYSLILKNLIFLLEKEMCDENGWIEYYIFDLECGEKYFDGCVKEFGNNITIKTPEDLYNFLIKNK